MGAAARGTLERDENSIEGAFGPRSRRGPTRGGRPALERDETSFEGVGDPRVRQICTGAAPYPSSVVEFRLRVAGPIV
jgi:hypothetical protein